MKARSLAISFVIGVAGALLAGCRPAAPPSSATAKARALPDMRLARDRPPVVLVAREGDPSAAIALAVTTSALGTASDDPEIAVALAAVVEARLLLRALPALVTPSWSGYRAALLVATLGDAERVTAALRDALVAPIDERDLTAAKKKLAALGARPLRDGALGRWARCVGSPFALPDRAGRSGEDLDVKHLEAWRASAHGLGRVAFAVAANSALAESVASSVARLPVWKPGQAPVLGTLDSGLDLDVNVYQSTLDSATGALIHVTLDVGTGSDAVSTAEALGDPHGPLAARLAALQLPYRLREVVGSAEPRGGCVGVVLEAAASSIVPVDIASLVADAVALVHVEAQVRLAEGVGPSEGRSLARRAGDARDAAERAAWWALADSWPARPASASMRGSVALGLALHRGAPSDAPLEPSREALATAMQRSALSWQRPVVEGRTRVEPGQGETWVLIASPCGTDGETDADAGLTALFTVAAAELAMKSPEARVEPWIVADGAGLLVHGPALPSESPSAHARRLADVVARSFASETLVSSALGHARGELLHGARADGPAFAALAAAVAPGHASWFVPTGREDTFARAADASVLARAQALRAGPLRVAVLASEGAAQGDAALRAADRWIARRSTEVRSCRPPTAAAAPRPGTYTIEPRPGAVPEAYLAFPFAKADEAERAAAVLLAAALEGEGGLLEKSLAGPGMARSWSARVVGWPRAPALVVRVVAAQDSLDNAVMQARALVDRIKSGGLDAAEYERASSVAIREAVTSALDPRARVIATWRGETVATAAQPMPRGRASSDALRAFAAKRLGEDALVILAARPGAIRTPDPTGLKSP